MKTIIITLLLFISLVGFFYLQYGNKDNAIPKYYVFYKDAGGKIERAPITGPSNTPDGNIYMTGSNDPIVYGVGVGESGEIIFHSNSFDVATSFSQVIPPDNWNFNPTGNPWTNRMRKVILSMETGSLVKIDNMIDEDKFIYDLYTLFSQPKTSPLLECAENLNKDIVLNADAGKISKEICSRKVPEDLKFEKARTDPRYSRMRMGLFYKAYSEKNSEICKNFLKTQFSDENDDSLEVVMYSYLLCGTLANGDKYSKEIPLSEALRRVKYRFGVAIEKNKCALYDEPEMSSMCVKVYNHLQTKRGINSSGK